jgi:poly(A) polymerase
VKTETHEEAQPERALSALRWAAEVAQSDPEGLARPPDKPEAPEWRAVPLAAAREEMDRLLLGKHPEEGLDALLVIGALDVWMPEVAAMVGFGDGEWRHKDVWKHTKQVVWQSVPRLAVRWGALLHDIGKVKTRRIEPNGEVHFFGHSEVGAAMFRKRVARRLGFEGDLYERVHYLILHHLRASQYDGSWTDSAVRRFAREMGDGLTDLLDLSRADITTKRPERKKKGLRQISELAARIRKIQETDAKIPPLPKGVGHAIMTAFEIPPSRRIGEIKQALEDAIDTGEIEARREEQYYVDFLTANREKFAL